jgi:hypothetical protein
MVESMTPTDRREPFRSDVHGLRERRLQWRAEARSRADADRPRLRRGRAPVQHVLDVLKRCRGADHATGCWRTSRAHRRALRDATLDATAALVADHGLRSVAKGIYVPELAASA